MVGVGRVDVVIPTFNGARLLPATLDSVLGQTHPDVVITVVDDGSTDGTRETVLRYGSRVRYLHKANGGQASARNLGCRSGSGDYVCFVDSDDLLLPNMLEVLTRRLSAEPETDVCYAKVLAFDGSDSAHPHAEAWRPFVPWPTMLEPLTAFCAMHGSATLLRRRVFDRHGFLPEERRFQGCEDWHFWLTLVLGGARVAYVPQVLALYRQHIRASSASARGVATRESTLVRAMVEMFRFHGVADSRARQLLAVGIFAVALRWIPLGDRPSFLALVRLAEGLVPGETSAARLVASAESVNAQTVSEAWLQTAEAYLGMGVPELAAISFNRVAPNRAALSSPVLESVVEASSRLVSQQVAAHAPGDHSYLGHTARQLGRVCRIRGDAAACEKYLEHARLLDPNDARNDMVLAAALIGRGAWSQAAEILFETVTYRPHAFLRAGVRPLATRIRQLLK